MGIDLIAEDEKEEDRRIPEDTIHRAVLKDVTLKVISFADKQTGEAKSFEKLDWLWEIVEGKYTGRKVHGSTEAKLTTLSTNRLRAWSSTLLDREITVGFPLNTDDLVGLQADLSIRHRVDRKDSSRVFEEVDDLLPTSGYSDQPPF